MREIIAAFRDLSHEVEPLIMGGIETRDVRQILHESILKKIARSIAPKILWETLKDLRIQKFDDHAKLKLISTIDRFNPDLIYERSNYLQTSGVSVARKFGIPHVLEINAPILEERKRLSGEGFFKEKAALAEQVQLEKTNKIVVVSSSLKDYYQEKFNLPDEKFLVTPNAVNLDVMKMVDSSKANKIKEKFKLQKKMVIGFVGSIFPWHGVDILLKAFSKLRMVNSNLSLLVVGDGQIIEELKTFANQFPFRDDIIFTGKVPHETVFNYIDCMDITVMAKSNWYGSPVKIFEYGILGKAIIAPKNGPVRDVMIDGIDGILVEPIEEQLLNAMDKLINSEELRCQIGMNFKEKILKNHTWKINAMRILNSKHIAS